MMLKKVAIIALTAAGLIGGGFANAQMTEDLFSNTSDGGTANFGRCGANRDQIAQKFEATTDTILCYVNIRVAMQNSPTDGVTAALVEGLTPDVGTTIATAPVDDIDSSYSLRTATFETCQALPVGTIYWVIFYRNSSCDDTNFYVANTATVGANLWQGKQKISGTWSDFSPTKAINTGFYGSRDFALYASYSSSSYGFNDPDFGTFGNAMIDIAKWLFVPSPSALGVLASQREALMQKPPFVWASTASSTLGGLDGGDSTTSTSIMWTATTTAINETISLFTPTDIENKIPESVRNFVRAIGATLIWAMFFSWIVSLATSGHITDHVGIHPPSIEGFNAGMDDELTDLDDIDALHGSSDEDAFDA